jgi:hypothetical protein
MSSSDNLPESHLNEMTIPSPNPQPSASTGRKRGTYVGYIASGESTRRARVSRIVNMVEEEEKIVADAKCLLSDCVKRLEWKSGELSTPAKDAGVENSTA